jgi:3'(2'), 5'-bisphosphate nucleotidase
LTVSDDDLAAKLAGEAGRRLIELRARGGDAKALRDAGDRLSHEFLTAELARLRPGDAVLSEEGADDPARLSASRVWIVDPLDGTREYGEPGRTDWAVHVALWADGELTAGAVGLPAQGTVLSTAAVKSGGPPTTPQTGAAGAACARTPQDAGLPLRLLVSRTRPPEFMTDLAGSLDAVLVPMGSAGAKAAAVINGQADAYIHSGGQYEWDSAAPVAVAKAAGLHASRIDGSDLRYNQAHPSVPDILICPIELAATLLSAINRSRSAQQAGLTDQAEPLPSDPESS